MSHADVVSFSNENNSDNVHSAPAVDDEEGGQTATDPVATAATDPAPSTGPEAAAAATTALPAALPPTTALPLALPPADIKALPVTEPAAASVQQEPAQPFQIEEDQGSSDEPRWSQDSCGQLA